MIGVLLLAAVLLALRAATIVPMADEAWTWWQKRARIAARQPAPIALPPMPPREMPVAVPPSGRVAEGDEAAWIVADDYPAESIWNQEQGTSTVRWTIRTDGRVEACRTVTSSGFARLDAAACRAITTRGRYRPARDTAGRAIVQSKMRRVRWVLPR